MNPYRPIIIWLFTGCFFIYLMVLLGGITRLTGSGLSITEWKIVTGIIPPLTEAAWEKEFEAYKQIPQYKLINAHFQLNDFKRIYWWEYIHRLMGRLLGIIFLVPFVWFWIRKKFPKGFISRVLLLFLLGGIQGVVGWFMVKSGLSENVYVSHYRLAIHLVLAFATFGYTFWLAWELILSSRQFSQPSSANLNLPYRLLPIIFFIVLTIQIIYGAFVAGLKAGYAYPTFPKMGETWIPDELMALTPWWKNFLEGHAGVQFIHRYLAYLLMGLAILLFYWSRHPNVLPAARNIVLAINAIIALQFLLGVFTLLYRVPISLALLHQTGVFLLFGCALLLLRILYPPRIVVN